MLIVNKVRVDAELLSRAPRLRLICEAATGVNNIDLEAAAARGIPVRNAAGIFDVSHMGEITVEGPDAVANLNYLLTNDFSGMTDGQARYSPMCNDDGGVVDDLIAYRKDEDEFLLVVNAANKDKDFNWIKAHAFGDVTIDPFQARKR